MTDTTDLAAAPAADEAPRRSGGLSTMRLAELQGLASSLGLSGTAKMRKGDLITAIKARQSGGSAPAAAAPVAAPTTSAPAAAAPVADTSAPAQASTSAPAERPVRASRRAGRPAGTADAPQGGQDEQRAAEPSSDESRTSAPDREAPVAAVAAEARGDQQQRSDEQGQGERSRGRGRGDNRFENRDNRERQRLRRPWRAWRQPFGQPQRQPQRQPLGQPQRQPLGQPQRTARTTAARTVRTPERPERPGDNRGATGNRADNRTDNRADNRTDGASRYDNRGDSRGPRGNEGDDDERGGRRRNRQRSRDRKRGGTRREGEGFSGGYSSNEPETIHDDDVLIPVAGILDVLDNYAFVRTSGYLPGENDVYVPLGIVKKNGLRKGDAVTGAVKAMAEGEQLPARQKFNALVRLDTVNGKAPEESRSRVEFGKLTPLYPQERLRLETEQNILSTRLIDLIAPIGKGQRGLIVSPPKAGKTLILQAIANAISVNNPEAHLMIVLVDERPEEVTDMQRTVKGEVIASTFDRPATDHTTVAELAIERAKRLVELGHDVVVLLDSITRLGRAYNLAAPASGRILSGGVDSSALYPPKRFFGAARNIEHGGSLTILATALVETGSKMDEVIFEEFKGTGNMELRLSRSLADRRIFPAIDVNPSGTRREEILMANEELKIVWKLRRVLSALDQQQGIELLIDRLKKSKSNVEFLMQVQKTSSIQMDDN